MDDPLTTMNEVGQAVETSAKIIQNLHKLISVFNDKGSSREEANFTNFDFLELSKIAQDAIADATSMHYVLIEKDTQIRKLENELSRRDNWNQEKHRYILKQISGMSFAYCLKDEYADEEEPIHLLCVNCVSDSIKSLLHKIHLHENTRLRCPRCEQFFAYSHQYLKNEN